MSNKINLQLFGDVDGALNSTSTLTGQMKTFYDTELLENARPELFHTQFGKKQGLPAHRGRTIEWRKWNTLPNASVLTEGVVPSGQKFGQSVMTSELSQYGMYVPVSDQLELHAVDDVILGATEELGASAGATEDILARNALIAGTNVIYAPKSDGTAVTARAGLTADCRLTSDLVNKAVTAMKKLNAPKIDGKYVAIIHPSVAYDLRKDDDWIDAHKYAAVTEIFNGEIGELHGCRFVESTNAKIFRGDNLASNSRTLAANGAVTASNSVTFDGGTVASGALAGRYVLIGGTKAKIVSNTATVLTLDAAVTCADNAVITPGEGGAGGIAVYATLFFGRDAYGIVDPDGAGLEMILHDRSQAGGPLDQFSTVGYKLSTAAKILYEDRMIRVESGSSYSDEDDVN